MREDIFAKMTDDTRILVQRMQAHETSPPLGSDPVQLTRDGYRQIIPLSGLIEEVEAVEDYKVLATSAIPLRLYRPRTESN